MANIADCRIIEFTRIVDPRGALTPIEGSRHVPFDIQRVYYLYDVPSASSRAGHSHLALRQVLIAIAGSFDVHVDDGVSRQTFRLSLPNQGLFIPRMIWREIDNFSAGAVCLSLASLPYDESDYIRNYDDFKRAVQEGV